MKQAQQNAEVGGFTPGPWNVQRTITGNGFALEMTGHNSDGEAKYSVFVESPAYVLAGVSGTGKSECLGNARLIASAPELLSALELAKATIERLHRHAPGSANGTLDVINSAIAKATGNQ